MGSNASVGHTHLFVLRLWLEPLSEGRTAIRGEVRHVLSGRRRAVQDWVTLTRFIDECVGECDPNWTDSHPPDEAGANNTH